MDRAEKVVTATDVERLVVTNNMLDMLPPVNPDRDIPIRVFDSAKSRVYEFKLSGRRCRIRKPVFHSKEWKAFVKDRGMAVGDVLPFWAEENPIYLTQYRLALYNPALFPGHPDPP